MIYDIAGLRIAIYNKYEYTDKFCRAYLSKDQVSPVDVKSGVSYEEIEAERENLPNFPDGYVENVCLYRDICSKITLLDRFLLHAAVLEYKGNAYAFLGRSGTGKSTHTGLWLRHVEGTKIVNGDKPIIHYTGKGFLVYGTPWMGKERLGYNTSVPLKALCFLEQSTENCITKLSIKETVRLVFPQILHPGEEANAARMLELADNLVREVSAYVLRCTISEDAVKKSFEMLTGEKYQTK